MTPLLYEWRKLFRLPALWGFLALCLAFNGLLIYERTFPRDAFNEASAITAELGQRVDGDFLAALERRPASEYGLLEAAEEMTNIFGGYDTQGLANFYQGIVKDSPLASSWMAWKYALLQGRADHLAETGAAMDLYAGPATQDAHQFLFSSLLWMVTAEGAALGMLSTLYLLGCEDLHRTSQTVYSTRTGRRLCRWKILAGAGAAVLLYVLLAAVSLGVYFALWDYSGIWNASVSSQFNFLTDMLRRRPFLTWGDFTVAEYLAAALALSAVLVTVFSLLAAFWGLLVRNTYAAALVLMVLCAGGTAAPSALAQAGLWPASLISCFQPVYVWLSIAGWFTELGLNAVLPWQETLATAAHLALWGAGSALALRRFARKDLL